MPSDRGGSVTILIGDMKKGGQEGARKLFSLYSEKLFKIARRMLHQSRRHGAAEDADDAVNLAFKDLFLGAADGKFPDLMNRVELSRLLKKITRRQVQSLLRRQFAAKRGSGMLVGLPDDSDDGVSNRLRSREPSPEHAVQDAEIRQRFLDALEDDSLRSVFDLDMEGCKPDDIARRLCRSEQTVRRKLDLIYRIFLAEVAR